MGQPQNSGLLTVCIPFSANPSFSQRSCSETGLCSQMLGNLLEPLDEKPAIWQLLLAATPPRGLAVPPFIKSGCTKPLPCTYCARHECPHDLSHCYWA